jgi:hypothetical protein
LRYCCAVCEGEKEERKIETFFFRRPRDIKLVRTLFMIILFLSVFGCGSGGGGSGSYPLPDSSASALLSWNAPLENADGTLLTDLGGYRVYYGNSSAYTYSVDAGKSTRFEINNLTSGTWCFAVTAYNDSGAESNYSAEVCKDV